MHDSCDVSYMAWIFVLKQIAFKTHKKKMFKVSSFSWRYLSMCKMMNAVSLTSLNKQNEGMGSKDRKLLRRTKTTEIFRSSFKKQYLRFPRQAFLSFTFLPLWWLCSAISSFIFKIFTTILRVLHAKNESVSDGLLKILLLLSWSFEIMLRTPVLYW